MGNNLGCAQQARELPDRGEWAQAQRRCGSGESHEVAGDREPFRDAIGRFATGVTVVSTAVGDDWYGMTVSAVASLCLDPPMLVVCLNQNAQTHRRVLEAGAFGVSVLREQDTRIAARFAGRQSGKFDDLAVDVGATGCPVLRHAVAQFDCRVWRSVTGGTHRVFLAEVLSSHATRDAPLAYFRGTYGAFQPHAPGAGDS